MTVTALSQKNIALLACSGFEEKSFVSLQQALIAQGAKVKVISRDSGLTNGWADGVWGLSYPVDAALSETLAIDYDVMIVPDGERHSTMLINDPHGRRVVNAFLRENVAGLVIGSSIEVMAAEAMLDGYQYDKESVSVDKNLVLAPKSTDTETLIAALGDVLSSQAEAAAA